MPKTLLTRLAFFALSFLILFFISAIILSQVILKGETVTVPDITGKTVTQARTELSRKDLSMAVQKTPEFDDKVPRGLVIRQEPAAGSRVRITKPVQVVTSAGSRQTDVPDLANKSLDTALTLLSNAGLFKGKLTQIHTPRYPAGRVIAQEPPPGETVDRNSQVGLLLSQGDREDRFLMPDLIGRKADRVTAQLKALDFKVSDVTYVYYPGAAPGVIVKQYPANGYRIQKGNLITLEVSR